MYEPFIELPREGEELADYIARTLHDPTLGSKIPNENNRITYAENVYEETKRDEITANAEADGDPTNTKTLRKKFSAKMYNRVRSVKGAVNWAIKEQDVLGIKGGRSRNEMNQNRNFDFDVPPVRKFEFSTDTNKHKKFMRWIEETMERGILSKPKGVDLRDFDKRWTDNFIRRGYEKGVNDATVRSRGVVPGVPEDFDAAKAMGRPVHLSALETVYTRTFDQLKGVTKAGKQTISRVLSNSLAEGIGTEQTARRITREGLDKVTLNRARTIARTETINAYNTAALNQYERLGFKKVASKAEWLTAGDLRVCPRCAGMEGITMKISRARGLIPLHPNCRCTWLPVVDKDRVGGRLSTKRRSGTLGNVPRGDERREARELLDI